MGIDEKILDHYTKYLGEFAGTEQYRFGNQIIQILGFPNVFKDCLVFATFGMSKYSEEIKRQCEVILAVDDLYDECSEILANTVCYILSEKMEFGRGIIMNEKEKILEAMKKAGEPLNAGKIAELTGLDRKVVDKKPWQI